MDRKGDKGNSSRSSRVKKRRFTVNQHTADQDVSQTSASARKISERETYDFNIDDTLKYFIVNFSLFFSLQEMVVCKVCKGALKFSKRAEKGLGFQLVLQCECEFEQYISNCPTIDRAYEIN